jgi:hypothetical protein
MKDKYFETRRAGQNGIVGGLKSDLKCKPPQLGGKRTARRWECGGVSAGVSKSFEIKYKQ